MEYVLRQSRLRPFALHTQAFRPPTSTDPEEYLNLHLARGARTAFRSVTLRRGQNARWQDAEFQPETPPSQNRGRVRRWIRSRRLVKLGYRLAIVAVLAPPRTQYTRRGTG